MFLALGLRAYAAAIFLLVTHAFYKALMFLSAGSVMHGMHDETDMKRMGGLRPLLPVTSIVFTAGALALSGVPPFAGFFSKDQIVAAASATGHPTVWVLATVGAFLSALYISRLISLTFLGARRSETGVHESPVVMTAPLGVLAVLSVTGGLLGLSATSGRIQTFLAPVLGEVPEHGGGLPEPTLLAISIVVASAGVALGWWLYGSGRVDWLALRARVAGFQRMLAAGGFVDATYARFLVAPATVASRWTARAVDRGTIDAAVDGVGRLVAWTAGAGRKVQTGFARSYALAILLGAAALLLWVGLR